jgi:AcrR family transcriptional regulator
VNKRSAKDSKKNILNAALKVFSERSYGDASMRMIASRAGISVGGLYLYFKNKEDIWLTLVRGRFEELSTQIKRALEGVDQPAEAMARFVAVNLRYARRHREMILTQSRDQGVVLGVEMRKGFYERQRRVIGGIIEEGIRCGVFAECDVTQAAKIVLGVLRGFVLSIVLDPRNLFSPQDCSKLILYGLLRRNERKADGITGG